MSDSINTVAALTRNFLADVDDLVDELLSALKTCEWRDLKMHYHLGKLQAIKTPKDSEEIFHVSAEWAELEEEVQLRIAVSGSDESMSARQEEAMEIMNALFPDDIFRKVNEDN